MKNPEKGYSLKEMQQFADSGAMGTAYVPFTFPTVTVRNNMQVWNVKTSNADVDRMWEVYYNLTTTDPRLPPYNKDQAGQNTPLVQGMMKGTGLSGLEVAAFLQGLEKAVNEQGWGWRWLDPALSDDQTQKALGIAPNIAKTLGDTAKNLLAPTADSVTNIVKYAALAVAGGAIVYGLYTWNKSKRRKRAKGG